MDSDFIIKDEADAFSLCIDNYMNYRNGHIRFKDKLSSELFNYDDSRDRLVFLYQTIRNIEEKEAKHLVKCKQKDNPEECPTNVYCSKIKFFTEQEIKKLNPSFDFKILRPQINTDLINENLISLSEYPKAAELYQSALEKLNEGRHFRNLIDDLRLSIEEIIKQVLDNKKSLENQSSALGGFLKTKSTSKEITNMIITLLDYFSKYQNTYIKHNDHVNKDEIDLLINLSSAFISFIINK